MTALITAELVYRTETNMLKITYFKLFSSKIIKAKIFILQINNKITDAAEVLEERKIKYIISLLKDSAAE